MKTVSKPLLIGIAIPKRLAKEVGKLSSILKKHGGLYTVYDRNYIAHITLYAAEFPVQNMVKVKDALRTVIHCEKALSLQSNIYRQNKFGYVDIAYTNSAALRTLQHKIVEVLNPLREGLLTKNAQEYLPMVSKIQKHNFLTYGYDYVGKNFIPHLTLSKLTEFDAGALADLERGNFSFLVNKICIFELGKYNTCKKSVACFHLKD